MKNDKLHKGLFIIILCFLCFPYIQGKIELFKAKPLKGSFSKTTKIGLKSNWINGKYQTNQEKYFNENYGFRNGLIRTHNQILFSFFHSGHANGVVVGKENYLYEINYIKAYYGTDFIGRDIIKEKIRKLKAIQDTLNKKNIELICIFAPGKASIYPEYIPEKYNTKIDSTNLKYYTLEAESQGISFLNFSDWFIQMKEKSQYPLFPKCGIHWSNYSEILVADSICHYINSLENHQIPNIILDSVRTSTQMENREQDVEDGMNLLWNIKDIEMGFPYFHIDYNSLDTTKKSDKVLVVSDSFYWEMFNKGLSTNLFNQGKFWYYNKQIYPDHFNQPSLVSDLNNITEELEKNNVIIIICTEANLYKFAYGFINDTYNAYYIEKELDKLTQLTNELIIKIKESPEWVKDIESKALNRGITTEEMIQIDAEYMAKQKLNIKD